MHKKNVIKKDSQKLLTKPHVIPSDCKSPLRKHPALTTEGGMRVADPGARASQDKAAESEFSRVYNQLRRDKQELVM